MLHSTLMEEDFPARLEAEFADRRSANAAASTLCRRFGLDASQLGIADRHPGAETHRSRFAVRASGRLSQKRQLLMVVVAFAVLVSGFVLVALLEHFAMVTQGAITVLLSLLLCSALLPLAAGLLSWRRAGVRGDANLSLGSRTVLLVDVHDISQQYEIREALREMGAHVDSADIAGVS